MNNNNNNNKQNNNNNNSNNNNNNNNNISSINDLILNDSIHPALLFVILLMTCIEQSFMLCLENDQQLCIIQVSPPLPGSPYEHLYCLPSPLQDLQPSCQRLLLQLLITAKNFIVSAIKTPKGRIKKEVKFWLLAEIRWGRGIQEPNLLSGIFLLFKNDIIAPKH